MGLYDVIGDITSKQVIKTETGDNRIYGVLVGLVVNNYDEKMPGRVCVSIPVRDEKANTLKWAKMAMNSNGKKWGTYFLPEVGDEVLLVFEGGSIEKPYIIGCVATDESTVVSDVSDADNQYKMIRTKYGSHIKFEDNKEGEGEKDKIQLQTSKETHTILMDNENNKIIITDKPGKNYMELLTEAGELNIKTEKKVTIKVGDNIQLTMNAESGAVDLKCEKVNFKADNSISMKAEGNFKIDGSAVKVAASSSFSAESDGAAKLKGSIVKIG